MPQWEATDCSVMMMDLCVNISNTYMCVDVSAISTRRLENNIRASIEEYETVAHCA